MQLFFIDKKTVTLRKIVTFFDTFNKVSIVTACRERYTIIESEGQVISDLNSVDRVLTETVVRKAIKDIKDSPERGTRNLLDMGINFASGRFQQSFLKTTRNFLQDDRSPCYHIIYDAVKNIETEKLVTFGMNLGYNSCTYGAKRIRELEKEERFDIPWTVFLDIGKDVFAYNSVIEQGEKIGIFTWQLFVSEMTEDIFYLISAHSRSAFILYCLPEHINTALIEKTSELNNLMFAVCYDDEKTAEASQLLRKNNFLYSVYYPYDEKDTDFIKSGEIFSITETLHPAFTVLVPEKTCSKETKEGIYNYVAELREEMPYQTIPWEIYGDSRYIDKIISDDDCFLYFDKNGYAVSPGKTEKSDRYSLFKNRLESILKLTFPK